MIIQDGLRDGGSIGLEDAVRLLMDMKDGSPIANLLVHCLLAFRTPRDRVRLDALQTMAWLAPMLPCYTTSPVHARHLAHRRGVRTDAVRTRDGWQTVAWRADQPGASAAVRVGASSEALALCAGTIAAIAAGAAA